jgi:hypothetical protein
MTSEADFQLPTWRRRRWIVAANAMMPEGCTGVPLPVVTPLSKDSDGIRLLHKYFYYLNLMQLIRWEVSG